MTVSFFILGMMLLTIYSIRNRIRCKFRVIQTTL
jgi:hypothetical protein